MSDVTLVVGGVYVCVAFARTFGGSVEAARRTTSMLPPTRLSTTTVITADALLAVRLTEPTDTPTLGSTSKSPSSMPSTFASKSNVYRSTLSCGACGRGSAAAVTPTTHSPSCSVRPLRQAHEWLSASKSNSGSHEHV